jgi:alcohol dehydrogenase
MILRFHRVALFRSALMVFLAIPVLLSISLIGARVRTVQSHGMGGVGRAGVANLTLSYTWIMRNAITVHGQWLYPRGAMIRLLALARAGARGLER